MSIVKSLLAIAITVGFAATAQAGVTYTSTPNGTGLWPLGVPDTTTYGQVFTAPMDGNNHLDSFSFFLKGSLASAYGGVAAWTGTGAGPELFKSAYFPAAFGNFTEITINTGSLNLTPGAQYVAYFSNSGIANSGFDYMELGNGSAVQNGVSWDNAGGGSPNHDNWNGDRNDTSMRFAGSMTFSSGSADVPEPGSLALLGLGIAGLAGMRRRMPGK